MDFSLDDFTRLYILKRMTADITAPPFHRPRRRRRRRRRQRRRQTTTTMRSTARKNLVRVDAVDFGKKYPKSELSSRFFGRLKILQDLEGHHETCEVPIWRSCEFLSVTSRFVSKNYPRCPKIQISMIFGGGVKVVQTIFLLTFGPKLTCNFWFADMMI